MSSTRNIENDLQSAAQQIGSARITEWFEGDTNRAVDFRCTTNGLILDYSKHRIDIPTRQLLLELAEQSALSADFDALTRGDAINITEERAALHTLLRGTRADESPELHAEIQETNTRLAQLVANIHNGERTGFGNTQFTDVVNMGIGGSDFGDRKIVCHKLIGIYLYLILLNKTADAGNFRNTRHTG